MATAKGSFELGSAATRLAAHHAEIAEALKNARRYRAAIQLHKDQFPDDPLTGEITLWAELDIPNSPSTTE